MVNLLCSNFNLFPTSYMRQYIALPSPLYLSLYFSSSDGSYASNIKPLELYKKLNAYK